MASLKNKVVIITGAASGIGKAAAVEFAGKGAAVILAARRLERIKELQEYISSFNENCVCVQTDVTREEDVIRLFDEAEKHFGRIDILVNNAGRGLKSEVRDVRFEDWLSVIHTNLTGVFLCSRELARRLIPAKSRGHIITISSISAIYGTPTYSVYCASKHGVTGFQRAIKWELRKYGIKVSTIHPARVDTEIFNVYKKRPHRCQMLAPRDIALCITAIASSSLARRTCVTVLNVFKRIYYFARYALK